MLAAISVAHSAASTLRVIPSLGFMTVHRIHKPPACLSTWTVPGENRKSAPSKLRLTPSPGH
jgi:hypothetical protein